MKNKIMLSVDKARKLTGDQSDYMLAKRMNVTRQCVSMWRKRGWIAHKQAAALLSD